MKNVASVSSVVCLFADHKHDDSMGAYTVFTLFNTETKAITTEGGMYSNLAYNEYTPTSNIDLIREASKQWEATAERKEGIYNKYAQRHHFSGCIVILKGSRKAPNKTPLLVVGDFDGGYNGRFNNYEPDQIMVEVEAGDQRWVSVGCIAEVVQGVYDFPIWYVSEKEHKATKYNAKQRTKKNNPNRLTFAQKKEIEHFQSFIDKQETEEKKADLKSKLIECFPNLEKHLK